MGIIYDIESDSNYHLPASFVYLSVASGVKVAGPWLKNWESGCWGFLFSFVCLFAFSDHSP